MREQLYCSREKRRDKKEAWPYGFGRHPESNAGAGCGRTETAKKDHYSSGHEYTCWPRTLCKCTLCMSSGELVSFSLTKRATPLVDWIGTIS